MPFQSFNYLPSLVLWSSSVILEHGEKQQWYRSHLSTLSGADCEIWYHILVYWIFSMSARARWCCRRDGKKSMHFNEILWNKNLLVYLSWWITQSVTWTLVCFDLLLYSVSGWNLFRIMQTQIYIGIVAITGVTCWDCWCIWWHECILQKCQHLQFSRNNSSFWLAAWSVWEILENYTLCLYFLMSKSSAQTNHR